MSDIMQRLKQYREDQGLTQAEVAERMNVEQPTVSELESGARTPRMDTLARYADALGCEIALVVTPKKGVQLRDSDPVGDFGNAGDRMVQQMGKEEAHDQGAHCRREGR